MRPAKTNKTDDRISLSVANNTAKGGKTMPAVAVLQRQNNQTSLRPANAQRLAFDSATSKSSSIQTAIQRSDRKNDHLTKSNFGHNATALLQLKSAAANKSSVPVIQFAELATDKLNVVGEDHKESKSQRLNEMGLSAEKTQSTNFWLESEFKTDWTGVHQQIKKKNTKGADPTLERVRFILAEVNIKLGSAFNKLELVMPGEVDDTLPELQQHDDSSEVVGQSGTITNEDIEQVTGLEDVDLDELLKQDLYDAVSKLNKSAADMYAQVDMTITEELYKHLHYLLRPDSPDTEILPVIELNKAARELKDMAAAATLIAEPQELSEKLTEMVYKLKEVHDYSQEARWIPGGNEMIDAPQAVQGNARMQRSMGMHEAANKNHGVHGVWKIGDLHVTDIKQQADNDSIQYNLLDRSEFQQIYNERYPE